MTVFKDWTGCTYELDEEDECPNCQCGTLGAEDTESTALTCRGECGQTFYQEE